MVEMVASFGYIEWPTKNGNLPLHEMSVHCQPGLDVDPSLTQKPGRAAGHFSRVSISRQCS